MLLVFKFFFKKCVDILKFRVVIIRTIINSVLYVLNINFSTFVMVLLVMLLLKRRLFGLSRLTAPCEMVKTLTFSTLSLIRRAFAIRVQPLSSAFKTSTGVFCCGLLRGQFPWNVCCLYEKSVDIFGKVINLL